MASEAYQQLKVRGRIRNAHKDSLLTCVAAANAKIESSVPGRGIEVEETIEITEKFDILPKAPT